jgi:hypothetical protein
MATLFAITAASKTVPLDGQRRGQAVFTVKNLSGRKLRGRALLAPQKPAEAAWLTLLGGAERDLPVAGSVQYEVGVSVPAGAPAGSYAFRLDMVDAQNPDDSPTQGPAVTFNVPAAGGKRANPYRILLVIAVLLTLAWLVYILFANR